MHPDARAVLENARQRHIRKLRAFRQAKGVAEEPEGMRHAKDPWNDIVPFDEMRLYLSQAARETLRRLKHGKG
jgi:hypothetical protein